MDVWVCNCLFYDFVMDIYHNIGHIFPRGTGGIEDHMILGRIVPVVVIIMLKI
jgi:hypothetical protein